MTKTEAAALRHREAIAAGAGAVGGAIATGAKATGLYLKTLFVGTEHTQLMRKANKLVKNAPKRTARSVKKTNARSAGK